MEQIDKHQSFGGQQLRFRHYSETTACEMTFSVYLPPQANDKKTVPVVLWLSGLTCTDENFVIKAGAQRVAAKLGLAIIVPDTSPRGEQVPGDPDGHYAFGHGAGFYVNATQEPYSANYQMYDYVHSELPALVSKNLPIDLTRMAISGHSMGGHGAIIIGLQHPDRYRAISAFAPICSAMQNEWGRTAFSRYLGNDEKEWIAYDVVSTVASAEIQLPLLVDQGQEDEFLEGHLKTWLLENMCEQKNYTATIRMQPGYDHSYFFVSSFIEEHLTFLYQHL